MISPTSTTSSKACCSCSTNQPSPDPTSNPAAPDPASSWAPHRIFNIDNSTPTPLIDYIASLEEALGLIASTILLTMQPGDVPAATAGLEAWIDFKPNTPVREGVARFVA